MRAFSLSVAVALLLAIGASFGLNAVQQSSANAYSSSESTRLDRDESVNSYGRVG
jgi:hypothetical protein